MKKYFTQRRKAAKKVMSSSLAPLRLCVRTTSRHSVLQLITIALAFIGVAFVVFARTAYETKTEYALASDLPRGAFVYVQFSNLPALIEQWDRSPLKERYLKSTNYQQLQHRHLMLKLISRWEEFNTALGFQVDVATITGTSETKAALAVYDIGQLDLVFIAPMSEEKAALTQFFSNKEQFEEVESPGGTLYYRQPVDADRGRQKQMLAFTTVSGRFILATDENLLLRTIANINRKNRKDSLADDPAFKTLSQKVKPHFLTIWVDQAKLNQDYYFKHYWLMQNTDDLKSIRAGMFDLEQQKGRWIERREFLTTSKAHTSSPISDAELQRLYSMVPEDAPLVRVRALENAPALPGSLLRDTLFDTADDKTAQTGASWSWRSYSGDDFYGDNDQDWSYDRYSYLDYRYDSLINDPYDARTVEPEEPGGNPVAAEVEQQFFTDVRAALAPARPSTAVLATRPHTSEAPLFVEFRKAAIIHLQSAANLRRDLLERAIARATQGRLTVAGKGSEPAWENRKESEHSWRQLHLPMLGWEICYAMKDGDLIVANSAELLKTVLATPGNKPLLDIPVTTLDDLTIVRFDQRKSAFDDIMKRLDDSAEAFFSGNIGSLLDVASELSHIEITRRVSSSGMHEEIHFVLKV